MKRIGISACFFHADPKRPIFKGKTLLYIEESLARWAQSQGAIVYMIPSTATSHAIQPQDYASDLDGLILHGGSDVSPKSYGEEPLKPEWAGDYVRDQYEIALLREFMTFGKPVMGICRGAQLLNVALGGTLIQDIPTQIPSAGDHRNWEIYDQNFHEIAIEPGSKLSKIYQGSPVRRVNSIHHQALGRLGKDLRVEARSVGDDLVEAIRLDPRVCLGEVFAVQWHPEFHDTQDRTLLDSGPLMNYFLDSVKKGPSS